MVRISPRLHSTLLRPLVLLHGLGTGPGGWEPQIEAFSSTREVLSPPLLGPEPFTFERATAALDSLLWEQDAVDVCGLSLGALVGLRYAAEHPERVARLAVCAGFVRLPSRHRAMQAVVTAAMGLLWPRRMHRSLASGVRERYREAALEELSALTPRQAARIMAAGSAFDLEDALPALTMPVLALCGERDGVNLPLSRALPDARFEVVPGAGHVANLDNPEAFTALLGDFLDG